MSTETAPLVIARGKSDIAIIPKMANRHGLIAGATGTGKTVTLRTLAEQFSALGVPVFMADVKGDLSGLPFPGGENAKVRERIQDLKFEDFEFQGFPVMFWDVFGEQGHPVRTTVSEMGPLLISRILTLNEIQGGVLTIVFKVADDNGLLLLDLKDLRAMLQFVGDEASQLQTKYGNISAASIGAIQRGLLSLEEQGGDKFFGEPALNLHDLIQTDAGGKGIIHILAADRLMQSPKLYATFLLWMLAELFEQLPETGDPEKPKLVFFFDEAHLLFDGARGRIFHHPEPPRSTGNGPGAVGQPGAARPAGLHAERPEDGESGGGYVSRQSRSECRHGHYGAGSGRGTGFRPGQKGGAHHGGTGVYLPAPQSPDAPDLR